MKRLLLFIITLFGVLSAYCPSDFTLYTGNNMCYRRLTTAQTWSNARSTCISLGANLVTITNDNENTYVNNMRSGAYLWIGYNNIGRSDNKQYVWTSGSTSTYTKWASSQPDNYGNNQHCACFGYAGNLWDDVDCAKSTDAGINIHGVCQRTQLTYEPTIKPSSHPSSIPSSEPSGEPSSQPTGVPSYVPSSRPSSVPTDEPRSSPSGDPTTIPSSVPSNEPSGEPTCQPTCIPSSHPSSIPSSEPSGEPSSQPTGVPSNVPSGRPSCVPTDEPTSDPSGEPTCQPTCIPSSHPSSIPSSKPSGEPSSQPTGVPSYVPSGRPSCVPTDEPTSHPSGEPTCQPTCIPSSHPSSIPSGEPSGEPSSQPTGVPSNVPSSRPSSVPTDEPTSRPTGEPTTMPSSVPSNEPSGEPTCQPTCIPSSHPSSIPSSKPSGEPSSQPTGVPSNVPSGRPSCVPTDEPTSHPTLSPSTNPTMEPTLIKPVPVTKSPTMNPTTAVPIFFPASPPLLICNGSNVATNSLDYRGIRFIDDQVGKLLGGMVTGIGDFNGDGYDDMAIISLDYIQSSHTVHLFYGSSDSRTSIHTINSNEMSTLADSVYLQMSLDGIGDFNMDGYDDFMIGAPFEHQEKGAAYIYFGGNDPSFMFNSKLDGIVWGIQIIGARKGDHVGYSVSGIGDTNGDGCEDILIGSPDKTVNQAEAAGVAYLLYCQSSGVYGNYDLTLPLAATRGMMIAGNRPGGLLGTSVSALGDINLDEYHDFAIGEPGSYLGDGRIYIIYGSPKYGYDASLTISLSALYQEGKGFAIYSSADCHSLGLSFNGIGDINNDGYDDIIIKASIAYTLQGRSMVIYGNNQQQKDIDLDNINSEDGFVIIEYPFTFNSQDFATGNIDINRDGAIDLIFGFPAIRHALGGESIVVAVIFGKADKDELNEGVNVATLTCQQGLVFTSSCDCATSASTIVNVGDVNGDGYADVAVGVDEFTIRSHGSIYLLTNPVLTQNIFPTQQPNTKPPTSRPTRRPTFSPTIVPTKRPTFYPTTRPTTNPSSRPTLRPVNTSMVGPSNQPSNPSDIPNFEHSFSPASGSGVPSVYPAFLTSHAPTESSTYSPSREPTFRIVTKRPTRLTQEPSPIPSLLAVSKAPTTQRSIEQLITIRISVPGRYYGSEESEVFQVASSGNILLFGNGGEDVFTIWNLDDMNVTLVDFNPLHNVIDLTAYPQYASMSDLSIRSGSIIIQLSESSHITFLHLTPNMINENNFIFRMPTVEESSMMTSTSIFVVGFAVLTLIIIYIVYVNRSFIQYYQLNLNWRDWFTGKKGMVQHHEERLSAYSSRKYVNKYFTTKYGESMPHVDDEHLWSKQSSEVVQCLKFLKTNVSSCTKATCYKIISLLDHANIDIRDEAFETVSSLLQDKTHSFFTEESRSLVNEILKSTYYDDARDNILALLHLEKITSSLGTSKDRATTDIYMDGVLLPHHNIQRQKLSLADDYNNADDEPSASYVSSSSSSQSNLFNSLAKRIFGLEELDDDDDIDTPSVVQTSGVAEEPHLTITECNSEGDDIQTTPHHNRNQEHNQLPDISLSSDDASEDGEFVLKMFHTLHQNMTS